MRRQAIRRARSVWIWRKSAPAWDVARLADDERLRELDLLHSRATPNDSRRAGNGIDQVIMGVRRMRNLVATGALDAALERASLIDQPLEARQRDALGIDK